MSAKTTWDPEMYEARHSFVWQLGESVIDLLDPQPGERILDLGCGTGQLTSKLAERGAIVVGVDASPDMIGQARQNFPGLQFSLQDAVEMMYSSQFDAVFSNAALHWMLRKSEVAAAVARALRPGGRFVAEMGGKGNISQIEAAIYTVLPRYGVSDRPVSRTFFPSIAEYSTILEEQGLEVRFATLFDRPTALEGERGMRNWLRQFSAYRFEHLSGQQKNDAEREVVEALRPKLYRDGIWYADYRRLRFVAVRL
jgi:trans-aconitate methyltransferase